MEEPKRRSDRTAGKRSASRLHDVRWVATALAVLVAAVGTLLSVPLLVLTSGGSSGGPSGGQSPTPVVVQPPTAAPTTAAPSPPGETEEPTSPPSYEGTGAPDSPGAPGSPSPPSPSTSPSRPAPRPSPGNQAAIGQLVITLPAPAASPSPSGFSTMIASVGTVMTPAVALVTFLLGRRRGAAEGEQPDGGKEPGRS